MRSFRNSRNRCRLAFEPLEPRVVLDATTLLITEFLAVNDDVLADENGDFSDWIEIYNPNDETVEPDGWQLTDDPARTDVWRLPDMSLDGGQYLTVFASGKDRNDPSGKLHTDFQLTGDGEYLALLRPDGSVAHDFAPEFPKQEEDFSFGLLQETVELVGPGAEAVYRVPNSADSLR